MCHQARSDRRSMVIVILKGDNIPDVIRILNILRRSNGNAYFWITKENSKSGREVKRKFGSTGSDLLIMAPTTSRPILIERFCGDNLQLAREEDMVDAMKRAADAVDAFTREWERLEQERSLKREQEISLQKAIENDKTKLIKKSSKKIREARQGRVTQPSLEGEKEVYDWAGSNECLPLYFTIQRGREVVRHGDLLERTEVLHICERDEAEIESLLGSKVTFQGNVPDLQSDGELSSTLPDEDRDTGNKNEELLPVPGIVLAQAEEGQEVLVAKRQVNTEEEEKVEDEEEEEKREHREEEEKEHTSSKLERKRKKKDRRTTAKRKKEKEDSC
ncbi:eukaryotic translation initiation factor 5B-like isoform X2 [Pocillopora verrucosa]|uniref:eukaryotic translation initiation factor 5B-like isoform X2 n=1 Tax=Pocillopora verrucosa TaxID=203993 RepID=UPI0033429A41